MIYWLEETSTPGFPPTHLCLNDPNGLLAAGGRLSPIWLDQSYRQGIFPWHSEDEPRLWWSPVPRAVITPVSFRTPRTVRKQLRKTQIRFTANMAFEEVIKACQSTRKTTDEGTWINNSMIQEYSRLSHCGRAISVECWHPNGTLVGGFYGLTIGRAFFGESMFSRNSDTSKLAFALAAPIFFEQGVDLIDCQMHTDHLARFGLEELNRDDFESKLRISCNPQLHNFRLTLPSLLNRDGAACLSGVTF